MKMIKSIIDPLIFDLRDETSDSDQNITLFCSDLSFSVSSAWRLKPPIRDGYRKILKISDHRYWSSQLKFQKKSYMKVSLCLLFVICRAEKINDNSAQYWNWFWLYHLRQDQEVTFEKYYRDFHGKKNDIIKIKLMIE